MIVAETIQEFNDLSLPGYGEPASLDAVIGHEKTSSVLTALIASQNPDTGEIEILTGVRGGEVDQLYQWAISIGTGQIKDKDMLKIVDDSAAYKIPSLDTDVQVPAAAVGYEGDLSTYRDVVVRYKANPLSLSVDDGLPVSALVKVTNALLVRKFTDPTVEDTTSVFNGTVSHYDTTVGLVGADGEGIEYNTFANGAVMLDDRRIIPDATPSYQSLSWTSADNFLEGLAKKRPELINPRLSGEALVYVCTRGQCMIGARSLVEQAAEFKAHLGL